MTENALIKPLGRFWGITGPGLILVGGSAFSCQEPPVTVTSQTYQLSDIQ